MKKLLYFDNISATALSSGLRGGLSAYAVNEPKAGPPTALWLRLRDGRTIHVSVEMHDLSGWNEIGTLTFEMIRDEDAPQMTVLPASWADVRKLEKLVVISDECEAGCGFSLQASGDEVFAVVPGAGVYTLAMAAPFVRAPFYPEHDLASYARRPF